MRHARILLFHLFAFAALGACKSGDDNPNPTPTGLLSGYLTASRQLDLDSPATKYTEHAWAAFFKHPYAQPSDSMHIAVDSVRLNGINAMLENITKTYFISGQLSANTNCNWQVWSGNNIASFSYNFSTPYPAYTYKLPDTIDRIAGMSIQLPTGADSATIRLSGSKTLLGSYKGADGSFAAAQTGTLDAGNATLEVCGYKMTTQAFGGKNFLFTKRTVKTKGVWLK